MAEYVNPFGGYANGYLRGAQLENQTQLDARQARASDFDYQNLYPDKAAQSHLALREGLDKEPYYRDALNDASVESRAAAQNARFGAANNLAVSTGDISGIDAAGRYADPNYTNQDPSRLLRGADFGRTLQLYGVEGALQRAQSDALLRDAQFQHYAGQNPTAVEVARIRHGLDGGSGTPQGYSPTRAFFPTPQAPSASPVPQAPAVAPGATPAAPPGGNPQGSITPFHQLDPVAQAHVVHYTSQLTGQPIDAVHQHIASQIAPAQSGLTNQENYATV